MRSVKIQLFSSFKCGKTPNDTAGVKVLIPQTPTKTSSQTMYPPGIRRNSPGSRPRRRCHAIRRCANRPRCGCPDPCFTWIDPDLRRLIGRAGDRGQSQALDMGQGKRGWGAIRNKSIAGRVVTREWLCEVLSYTLCSDAWYCKSHCLPRDANIFYDLIMFCLKTHYDRGKNDFNAPFVLHHHASACCIPHWTIGKWDRWLINKLMHE